MYTNEKTDRIILYFLGTTFAVILVSAVMDWPTLSSAARRFVLGGILLNAGLIFIVGESYRLARNLDFRLPVTFSGWVGLILSAAGIYLIFEALFTVSG